MLYDDIQVQTKYKLICTGIYTYIHRLYWFKPSTYRRWTAAELKKVIAMLQHPGFDSKDIDPDLHQRMAKAADDGSIKCFNLLEGPADGDQDLNLILVHTSTYLVHTCTFLVCTEYVQGHTKNDAVVLLLRRMRGDILVTLDCGK